METIKRLTFKPLTGKRYRCNQTGEVVRQPKDYALTYYKKEQNKLNQLRGIDVKKIQTTNNSSKRPSKNEFREKALREFFWSEIQHRFIHAYQL